MNKSLFKAENNSSVSFNTNFQCGGIALNTLISLLSALISLLIKGTFLMEHLTVRVKTLVRMPNLVKVIS